MVVSPGNTPPCQEQFTGMAGLNRLKVLIEDVRAHVGHGVADRDRAVQPIGHYVERGEDRCLGGP